MSRLRCGNLQGRGGASSSYSLSKHPPCSTIFPNKFECSGGVQPRQPTAQHSHRHAAARKALMMGPSINPSGPSTDHTPSGRDRSVNDPGHRSQSALAGTARANDRQEGNPWEASTDTNPKRDLRKSGETGGKIESPTQVSQSDIANNEKPQMTEKFYSR